MFFNPKTASAPQISMEHIRELAGEITNSYLGAGAMPTDTLIKIAQSESLTPDHVRLVATEANKLIHQQKYASESEKYFAAEFPLADAALALKALQIDGGEVKTASYSPKPVFEDKGLTPFQMFGVEQETMDKTAEVKGGLKVASSHAELLKQKLTDKLVLSKYAAESAEQKFIKTARQVVLENSFSPVERLQVLGSIDHFCKRAEMATIGRKALRKVAYVLMREGLLEKHQAKLAMDYFEKGADQKAPSELISPLLASQAMIVNGQHPLYITLQTIHKHTSDALSSEEDLMRVDDRLKVMQQRIREL